MNTGTRLALFAGTALLGACGSSTEDGGGACTPGTTATITIRSTGVTPAAVCVLPTGSVTFTNADTAGHEIESGVACPQLNLGLVPPGESQTVTFPTVATCPFHDALAPTNVAFQGTVAVTNAPVTGPGY